MEAVEHGNAHLMARLRAVDPDYADTLTSENDLVRVVRALEVYELTGKPFSVLHRVHQAGREDLPAVQVALEHARDALYARINTRVDAMVAAGWLDEVRALLEGGFGPDIDRLKALGYREMAAHLRGEQGLEDAVEATKQHHRRYAKRQLTWFRADDRIHWLRADSMTGVETHAEQAIALLG
jgi:tRNA dimethylallyltransferase